MNEPKPLDLEVDKEEILKKYKYLTDVRRQKDFEDGFFHAIELIKQRIKFACEFYLKYKDNPELLAEEHPEYFSYIYKFEVVGDCKNVLVFKDILIDVDQYNEWLFKLAFKEVFDEVKEK